MIRHVFMISDGTGITAEHLGNSLLTQFENITFIKETVPYIDTVEKAAECILKINQCFDTTGEKPLIFLTLINPDICKAIQQANACVFDLFNTFLQPLEDELAAKSSYRVGKTHSVGNTTSYTKRMAAVEFALGHDDGVKTRGYEQADIVLIGVSRCGKTPSCLYMALHFGVWAANYPFTDEDLINISLPESLRPFKHKLFGLTISPERLHQIRQERRPNSDYASLHHCKSEVKHIEHLYKQENIPYLNSTKFSIEEISTKILSLAGIDRKF